MALGLPLLPSLPPSPPGFRFWLDEVLWSHGRVAVELIDEVLRDAGGVRAGGPPRHAVHGPIDRVLGAEQPDRWEVLWSKSTYALKAARSLRPGQQISAIVGLNSLTMKKRMLQTLKAAYGDVGTWQITPVSFTLPEELDKWRQWLAAERAGGGRSDADAADEAKAGVAGAEGISDLQHYQQQQQQQQQQGAGCAAGSELWILKTGQDAGKGLQLLPLRAALQTAEHACEQHATKRKHQLQVAQLYLTNPLLLEGRKSHLRLWVVVTHHDPLQAHLHRRGLVLFSSELYDGRQPFAHGRGSVLGKIAAGHLTNLARNSSGLVWGLDQLRGVLGAAAYTALWAQLQQHTADVLRAARGPLKEAHSWLRPAIPQYGFQLLGFDYMLDSELRPWLMEVNSAPSIMAEHDDNATAAIIRDHKQAMLRDMIALVRHRVWRTDGSKHSGSSSSSTSRKGKGRGHHLGCADDPDGGHEGGEVACERLLVGSEFVPLDTT